MRLLLWWQLLRTGTLGITTTAALSTAQALDNANANMQRARPVAAFIGGCGVLLDYLTYCSLPHLSLFIP